MCEGRARKSAVATADANENELNEIYMIFEEQLAGLLKSQGLSEDVALKCFAVLQEAILHQCLCDTYVQQEAEALLKLWDWQEDEAVIIKRKRVNESFEVGLDYLLATLLYDFGLDPEKEIWDKEAEELIQEVRAKLSAVKRTYTQLRASGKWKPFVGAVAKALEEVLQPVHFETKQDKWLLMYKIIDCLPEAVFVRPKFDLDKIEGWCEYKTIDTERAKWINSCLTAYEGKEMDWKIFFNSLYPEDKEKELQAFRDCWER